MPDVSFCSCTDTACPMHPSRHDKGCTPCIAKNLREGEIPSCFFHAIDHPKPTSAWHYADFAALVDDAVHAGKVPGCGQQTQSK
ncbi:MAG: hypothetical protein IJ865_09140 [Clostridia bacterium]|nr:hypothetical protein [Clostridia bacterium]